MDPAMLLHDYPAQVSPSDPAGWPSMSSDEHTVGAVELE